MSRWAVEGVASRLGGFALGPVDLELGPGEVVAVLGASGAGKTTLLRTLAGFLPAREGRIACDGVDLTGTPPERRGLGYVPQGLGLLPHRTVEGNVRYPLELRGRPDAAARARELLRRFGLTDLARRYPGQLSGGERERVALARTVVAEPELVLWDEPWQALDVEARHQLSLVLAELQETTHVPLVVVTHDPALAFSTAGTFLVLDRGRPVFQGRPEELLEAPYDAFTARFVGLENVYEPPALAGPGPGSLPAWLRDRAGPGGVAFPSPEPGEPPTTGGRWEGTVRAARPTPDGCAIAVVVDGLPVALRRRRPLPGAVPRVGDRLRFDVEEKTVRALGERLPKGGR